jgi:hypothetical protein
MAVFTSKSYIILLCIRSYSLRSYACRNKAQRSPSGSISNYQFYPIPSRPPTLYNRMSPHARCYYSQLVFRSACSSFFAPFSYYYYHHHQNIVRAYRRRRPSSVLPHDRLRRYFPLLRLAYSIHDAISTCRVCHTSEPFALLAYNASS